MTRKMKDASPYLMSETTSRMNATEFDARALTEAPSTRPKPPSRYERPALMPSIAGRPTPLLDQGQVPAVTRIGPHTLYCADAYHLRPLLGFFDAEFMDPPYRFDNRGGGTFRKSRIGADMIVEEGLDQGFDLSIVNPLRAGSVVIFCHNDQLPELLDYVSRRYQRFCLLGWIKKNPSPMRNKHYLADVEPYVHAWNHGYHPIGQHHDMHRWISSGTMPAKTFGHATVKPLAVMDKIMRNMAGDTVIDPFMGTGSTGVAAVLNGKAFTGIEKNPRHFATAVERITAAWRESQA